MEKHGCNHKRPWHPRPYSLTSWPKLSLDWLEDCIACFLIDKISTSVKAQLIQTALIFTAEIGLKVWYKWWYCTSVNISTFEQLGCTFGVTSGSIMIKFQHLTRNRNAFVMVDPCHMLKWARNTLVSLGSIFAADQEATHWKYFINLYQVKNSEGLQRGNKLISNHINFEQHKMKVSLVAQTLSWFYVGVVEFLNIVHKDPCFKVSEVTFIRNLDKLFDTLNSLTPSNSSNPWDCPARNAGCQFCHSSNVSAVICSTGATVDEPPTKY